MPVNPIYKPQRVAGIDRFLRAARSRFGGEPIPHKKLMREVLRRRREPRVYAMVADQTPTPDEPKHWTRFLNEDSAFFVGPDVVARAARAAVLFVDVERIGRGRYRMRLVPLAEPPYRRAWTSAWSRATRGRWRPRSGAAPADWLWVHRKWKYGAAAGGRRARRGRNRDAGPADRGVKPGLREMVEGPYNSTSSLHCRMFSACNARSEPKTRGFRARPQLAASAL